MSRSGIQTTSPADVLDALRGIIAVLDSDGVIVAVNERWRRFARENGCTDDGCYVGSDYLAVCERALAHGPDALLDRLIRDLRRMLCGEELELSAEYRCDLPSEARWYRLTATRLDGADRVVLYHEDITAQKAVELKLEEAAWRRHAMLEALPIGVWLMDETGRIIEGNRAGQAIWAGARYVGPEHFGEYKGWWLATGQPIAGDEWAAARAIRNGETSIDEEIEIECFDGSRKIILNSAIPLRDERQNIRGGVIVNQDITARVRADAELHRAKEAVEAAGRELAEVVIRERTLGRIDPLTGALNRRRFFELAEYELTVAARYQRRLSIILFDLDRFKEINDTKGHQAGDELLQGVVRVVRAHLRQSDVLARYGGDEFIILLPQTRARDAAVAAERMRADIAEQSIATSNGAIVTAQISGGIAELLGPDDSLDALIRRADSALYKAKKEGRNRVAIGTR